MTPHFNRSIFNAQRRSGGFTLLELLVVIVIIGLLAGYVAPRYFAQVGKSEIQVAKAQIDALEKALDQYRLDTRRYPSSEEGLQALVNRPASELNWNGPYLKKTVPNDPWGKPYVYRTPGQKSDYELFSYGRDGKQGGVGEDADIGSGAQQPEQVATRREGHS
jgi:general secretion pathway protein G